MPPIVKEKQTPSVTPETAARPASPSVSSKDAAIRQQPIALEIPVTVNGARTLDGSDKREPFSESTKTVMIFGNGAVIRLSAPVAPGQLLFLTNEKTKKEVVCQVVKSKNYRSVSGYVELEFTEPVVGFWGMRFPADRIGPVSQPAATAPTAIGSPAMGVMRAVPRQAEPKVEAPPASATPRIAEAKLPDPKPVAPPAPNSAALVVEKPVTVATPTAQVVPASIRPEFTAKGIPANPATPTSSVFDVPRAPEQPASIFAPPQGPAEPPVVNVKNWPNVSETKPEATAVVTSQQALSDGNPETEALKQHTARLQEELSTLLFEDATSAKPAQKAPAAPVVEGANHADSAGKVLETAARVKSAESANMAPALLKSSLDDEEMKIPAWLEPLARNAAAPASTQELVEKEKAKRPAEQIKPQEITSEEITSEAPPAAEEENVSVMQVPTFGNVLPIDENQNTSEAETRSSGKGLLLGALAAGVLLVAGGSWWYLRQQSTDVPAVAAANHAPAVAAPPEALQSQAQANSALQGNATAPVNEPSQLHVPLQADSHAQTDTAALAKPSPNPANASSAGISTVKVRNVPPTPNSTNGGGVAVTSPLPEPAPAEPKKPLLGNVHLAAPKVTRNANKQDGSEANVDSLLSEEQPDSNEAPLAPGLAVGNSQPSAPLAVGGDVKQANLISSVPPVYPLLAKNQHVSGDVRIDALIDANGRVTSMKIVSGPTLLHQAAMDALKQWKYRPAMLDGKPVAMHLTVTLQFRLQ